METITYYNKNAEEFVRGTIDADMSCIQKLFLEALPKCGKILDLGCGSGRDSAAFLKAGYTVDAVDGAELICREAEKLIGQKVLCATFEEFETDEKYDGIWACASLLHVKRKDLPGMVDKYGKMLSRGGTFYMSFKCGTFDGERRGRYFTDLDEEAVRRLVPEGLVLRKILYTKDVRPGRENTCWINVFLEKQ